MARLYSAMIGVSRLLTVAMAALLLGGGLLAAVRAEGEAGKSAKAEAQQTSGDYKLVNGGVVSGAGTGTGGGYGVTGAAGQTSGDGAQGLSGGSYSMQAGIAPTTILAIGKEGDVAPRQVGGGGVDVADWVQTGRFVVGLDTLVSISEYQRVDCAPRSSLGDGRVDVADWVQAGRYTVSLDAETSAGGPTQATSSPSSAGMGDSSEARELRLLPDRPLIESELVEIPVMLRARGAENALTLSVGFDAGIFEYAGAKFGRDAASGAELIVNARQSGSGVIGVGLRLAVAASLSPGDREVALLRFRRIAAGDGRVRFISGPAPLGLASFDATHLLVKIAAPERSLPALGLE